MPKVKISLLFFLQELKLKNEHFFWGFNQITIIKKLFQTSFWFSKSLIGRWVERSLVCLGNWPGWLVLRKPPSYQKSVWWRIKNHLKTSWKDIATTGCTIAGSCLGGHGAKELDWGTSDSVKVKGVVPSWKQGNFGLSLTYQLVEYRWFWGAAALSPLLKPALFLVW